MSIEMRQEFGERVEVPDGAMSEVTQERVATPDQDIEFAAPNTPAGLEAKPDHPGNPPRGRRPVQGLGRRKLKLLLAEEFLSYAQRLHAFGLLRNRQQWWTARDFLEAIELLRRFYRWANSLGDALGRGHGAESGMGMTRHAKRILPSRQ